MTRLILPLLAILASLHRLHGLLNNFPVPPSGTLGTFGVPRTRTMTTTTMSSFSTRTTALGATRKEADNKKELDNDNNEEEYYSSAPWEGELHCLLNKKRLEKAWVDRMVKSKTRFFPYKKCSEWAIRQNMWVDKKEWEDWIDMGEGKPVLVPSDPERIYTNQGTWVSWDDFLGQSQ